MPATVTTVERFSVKDYNKTAIEGERKLRIEAGAIRSSYVKDGTEWVLTTEWNVIGQG
ncbi:MAG: hypothetical protein AAB353_12655 [Candidatus Hydrogenedentota bacterium]